jgi:hypothetical protein
VQPVGQADAHHENAEDADTGKPHEREQQHWKHADQKDRQQRQ